MKKNDNPDPILAGKTHMHPSCSVPLLSFSLQVRQTFSQIITFLFSLIKTLTYSPVQDQSLQNCQIPTLTPSQATFRPQTRSLNRAYELDSIRHQLPETIRQATFALRQDFYPHIQQAQSTLIKCLLNDQQPKITFPVNLQ